MCLEHCDLDSPICSSPSVLLSWAGVVHFLVGTVGLAGWVKSVTWASQDG